MRRKDREMDEYFAQYVIDKSSFGSLAGYDINLGLINLPLSIVRQNNFLYFHSAKAGEKVEFFKTNPQVKITFITDIKIPENFTIEELNSFKTDTTKAKELISNVFTTEFASAIVSGSLSLVTNDIEKISAMKSICEKYTPSKMDFFDIAIQAGLNIVNVYKVEIESISSKRKKYDLSGKEMKFMRRE